MLVSESTFFVQSQLENLGRFLRITEGVSVFMIDVHGVTNSLKGKHVNGYTGCDSDFTINWIGQLLPEKQIIKSFNAMY